MTPTNELRFVEREIRVKNNTHPMLVGVDAMGKLIQPPEYTICTVRILQQKWTGSTYDNEDHNKLYGTYIEEWRDVPIEKE